MALTLVTGGSGSGKTEYIYNKIIDWSLREPERRFFVLVPEQATMQAQKDIIRLHPRHGTFNIDVVSFERLAYRIFEELSLPQPEILDDTGKTMVLRKLAGENRKELAAFSSHLNQAGFIEEIKSMLSEFYQYGVTPEMLKEQAEKELDRQPEIPERLAHAEVGHLECGRGLPYCPREYRQCNQPIKDCKSFLSLFLHLSRSLRKILWFLPSLPP